MTSNFFSWDLILASPAMKPSKSKLKRDKKKRKEREAKEAAASSVPSLSASAATAPAAVSPPTAAAAAAAARTTTVTRVLPATTARATNQSVEYLEWEARELAAAAQRQAALHATYRSISQFYSCNLRLYDTRFGLHALLQWMCTRSQAAVRRAHCDRLCGSMRQQLAETVPAPVLSLIEQCLQLVTAAPTASHTPPVVLQTINVLWSRALHAIATQPPPKKRLSDWGALSLSALSDAVPQGLVPDPSEQRRVFPPLARLSPQLQKMWLPNHYRLLEVWCLCVSIL